MNKIEKSEWIGVNTTVYYNDKRFKGKIIDETKNTLTIKTKQGRKKILKSNAKFEINGKLIDGKKVTKRPEDRIKIK